jgi:hypothetical protein
MVIETVGFRGVVARGLAFNGRATESGCRCSKEGNAICNAHIAPNLIPGS